MTEDEAFIRSIVDGRGDDTPRLAYADWLDDRADPRGAYLRAEAEWAKPWRFGARPADSPGLRELAAGLDPVWAARISRPPVGVCADHLRIGEPDEDGYGPGPVLTGRDLDTFEAEHRVTLPVGYRAFLLNQNGGCRPPGRVNIPAAVHPDDHHPWDTNYEVGDFYVVPPVGGIPEGTRCPGEVWITNESDGAMLYIADDHVAPGTPGYYLGLTGDRRGRVFYYHKHLEVWYPFVAPSFPEFLAIITPEPPEGS